MARERRSQIEFGDFQTPPDLAREVCSVVARSGFSPRSVIEPTCGRGVFLQAALEQFPGATHFLGADRDGRYVEQARAAIGRSGRRQRIQIVQGDFFELEWPRLVARMPGPILLLGNPPWVTNAALGALRGANLPAKANRDGLPGIDALTGRSNFDISEWMLRSSIDWLANAAGMLAVLCKTAVARKVLSYAWSRDLPIQLAELRRIDAWLHFGAAVDACLLIISFQGGARTKECRVYDALGGTEAGSVFGFRHGMTVADIRGYDRWHYLWASGMRGWRSGIKHDCSRIFELVRRGATYQNGLGRRVDVEPEVLFPLLKSSDLVRNRPSRKWLLVPQRTIAETPEDLVRAAPKAWQYLLANRTLLDRRASSVYHNRPRFSIFGVGAYSFAPWKVAVSGLNKKLEFVAVQPLRGRPVVFDDTCYFFPCESREEWRTLSALVELEAAREFWSALIFWDAKRPITAQILNALDLEALARTAGLKPEIARSFAARQRVISAPSIGNPRSI
jgi:hypothetical protein